MDPRTDPLSTEIRVRILEAAGQRFAEYGYGKTTMAEIARDCHMSAANLYRFFKNKLDIGAELAYISLAKKTEELRIVTTNQQISCSERLRQFVITAFEHTFSLSAETPRINELVMAICEERSEIIDQHLTAKQSLLENLIKEACACGEFAVAGTPSVCADTILCAIKLFEMPMYMSMYDKDVFISKANNVVDLLLCGLKKC